MIGSWSLGASAGDPGTRTMHVGTGVVAIHLDMWDLLGAHDAMASSVAVFMEECDKRNLDPDLTICVVVGLGFGFVEIDGLEFHLVHPSSVTTTVPFKIHGATWTDADGLTLQVDEACTAGPEFLGAAIRSAVAIVMTMSDDADDDLPATVDIVDRDKIRRSSSH